jgi:acyl dehydratase
VTRVEQDEQTYGQISDEKIERERQKIGLWRKVLPPHNYEVTRDGVRHFAFGAGDDNPLWCDPVYAAKTRWHGVIAPPLYIQTMGEDDAPPMTAEQKERAKGDPLAGVGMYQAAMEYEWWRPMQLGDSMRQRTTFVGIEPKRSEFGGRTVHETIAFLYANQRDELVAIRRGMWIRAEREEKKEKSYQLTDHYTDEQLAAIDDAYAAETRRGRDILSFDDVEIGQEFQPRVRGPLVTTDIIRWQIGQGMGISPPGSFRLSYETRQKVPNLFTPNSLNVPDTVQRMHWDPDWAERVGLPRPYDYGNLREAWLTMALCDWTGDDAWLWKFRCEHRHFNFHGDTTWITGRVVDKMVVDGRNEVHIELTCRNQFGTVTSPASAVVLLPKRGEPLSMPSPPTDDFDEMFQLEIDRFKV